MALPNPGMKIDIERTAMVIIDPQNDFLSPEGVTWGVVGESVTENNTVENIDRLFRTAKESGLMVYVSPHYYYPADHGWQFEGTLEALMHNIGMFDRRGPLSLEGFEGSGADWLARYKPYIEDGATVVVSPHKVYGPESNDLVLQLRKRNIGKVVLAGMSAKYTFVVKNWSGKDAGFVFNSGQNNITTDSSSMKVILHKNGEEGRFTVNLSKGNYTYFCPIIPTPPYPLRVK